MCDFDEFLFACGHSIFHLNGYCHRARNHSYKECHFVKKLRNVWDQPYPCEKPCGGPYGPIQQRQWCEERGINFDALYEVPKKMERQEVQLQPPQEGDSDFRLPVEQAQLASQQASAQAPAQALAQASVGATEQVDQEMEG